MSTSARQLLGLEDRIAAEAVASSKQGIRAHQAILHEFNAHLQLIVDQHRSIFDVSPDAALERYNAIVQLRRTIERVVSVHGPSTTEKLRPYRFKGVRKANHMGEGMFVNLPWAWWEARLKPLFLFDTAHPLPPLRSSIGDDAMSELTMDLILKI